MILERDEIHRGRSGSVSAFAELFFDMQFSYGKMGIDNSLAHLDTAITGESHHRRIAVVSSGRQAENLLKQK